MRRHLYLGAGIASVLVGVIGIALPILPTVPFLLLAAFCFARSNPAWERRLLDHPRYGPPLHAWRSRQAISRKAKISALLAMAAGGAISGFMLAWPWALIPWAVLLVSAIWIWTRNE